MKSEVIQQFIEARKANGISQRTLASSMHVGQYVIGRVEAGHNSPTLKTMERMAKALHMKVQLVPEKEKVFHMLTKEKIRELITPVCKKYGVKKAYLFGSYARGEANEKSDVDIRIERGKIRGLFALSGFRLDLVEALQKEVDLISAPPSDGEFWKNLLHDEVLLYVA